MMLKLWLTSLVIAAVIWAVAWTVSIITESFDGIMAKLFMGSTIYLLVNGTLAFFIAVLAVIWGR